jgi:hypothetical protein
MKTKKNMLKLALTGIVLLCISPVLTSQEVQPEVNTYSNEFRVGFFQFFRNTFYLGYERMFNNKGIVINGGITLYKDVDEVYGGQGEFQYRFYTHSFSKEISNIKLENIYLAPYAKYRYLSIQPAEDEDEIYNVTGGGILFGSKIVILNRLTIDVNLGGGIQYSFDEKGDISEGDNEGIFSPGYTGVAPTGNITFGVRF